MQTFDVVVVGGGSVGVPAAMALAARGQKVLVLERRPAVGQGENKAAIGGVRATHSDPAKILLCEQSLRVFTSWQEQHGDDIGWKPGGYAFPVYDDALERSLRALLPTQHRFSLRIEWIDAAAMAELIPGVAREGLRGGTWSRDDGQVSPLAACVAFQQAARRHGAVFRFGERVTGFEQAGGRLQAVVTDQGRYPAAAAVIAVGSDAAGLGAALGPDVELPVHPDSHEAGISAPVAPFLAPLVVDMRPGPEGKTANFYFGQNKEGQIIFCYSPRELFPGTDRRSTSEFLPILARRMVSLIPRLRHLLIRRVWRGCYPITPDGIPIVGRLPQLEGVTLAIGMCGQGFMLGPGVGLEVASLVCDGRSLLPAEAHASLRYDRPMAGAREALE